MPVFSFTMIEVTNTLLVVSKALKYFLEQNCSQLKTIHETFQTFL